MSLHVDPSCRNERFFAQCPPASPDSALIEAGRAQSARISAAPALEQGHPRDDLQGEA